MCSLAQPADAFLRALPPRLGDLAVYETIQMDNQLWLTQTMHAHLISQNVPKKLFPLPRRSKNAKLSKLVAILVQLHPLLREAIAPFCDEPRRKVASDLRRRVGAD
eukprot:4930282-Pyramimonas_sp.AAC.1